MPEDYQPEFGQMLFGHRPQRFEGSPALERALERIGENIMAAAEARKERRDNPFWNTGDSFENDVFKVEAYSWDDDYEQPFNFAWRDLRVSWYKHVGRGMSVNMQVDTHLVNEMLVECLGSIWEPKAAE
ncbi:hypothetical protein [Rhizobium leguminosarum]|uniref:hypothetical protein n=1 Tax=Rhizobium leguminosarum TaxID=384 RepID=UPI002E15C6B8|nr:hypothetical protein U8Q02_36705 [Rhizobium leguminosarum]